MVWKFQKIQPSRAGGRRNQSTDQIIIAVNLLRFLALQWKSGKSVERSVGHYSPENGLELTINSQLENGLGGLGKCCTGSFD